MKLVRSSKAIRARRQVVEIAAYIVTEVIPEAENVLSLLGEDMTRVSLRFQEDIGAKDGTHYHADIALSGWSGHWGTFATVVIDRQNARLRVWGRRSFEIAASDLGTREGNANIVAAIQDMLVSKQEHGYVLGTKYEVTARLGYCGHDGILTISYRLQKKVKKSYQAPLVERAAIFISSLLARPRNY